MPRIKLLTFLSALLAAILLFTIPASADLSSAFGMGKAVLGPVDRSFLLPADCTVTVQLRGCFLFLLREMWPWPAFLPEMRNI